MTHEMPNFFLPRGIRNNNPGNIRLSPQRWRGQKGAQSDTAFIEFETPVMGIRALMKLLLTYYHKYDLNTIESILNRYAPPIENATDAYIHGVTKHMGVSRTMPLQLHSKPVLIKLAEAITRHENGAPPSDAPPLWYDVALYDAAATLALSPTS